MRGGRNKITFETWRDRFAEKGVVLTSIAHFKGRPKFFIQCEVHGQQEIRCAINKHVCKLCAAEEASNQKKRSFSHFLTLAVAKYGDKFEYNEASFSGMKASVDVRCGKHGWFSTLASAHVFNQKTGCPQCGMDALKAMTKIKDGEKVCNNCKEKKSVELFPSFMRAKKGKTVAPICLDCKRDKDRVRAKRLYAEKDAGYIAAQQKARQKNLAAKIEQKQERDAAWMLANIGAHSLVHWHTCSKCSKQTQFKNTTHDHEMCVKCISVERFRGRKMTKKELNCVDCNTLIYGTAAAKRCVKCARKKARRDKRKADKIRGTSTHSIAQRARKKGVVIEPISRMYVYKRDAFMCYVCGIKVVLSKTYRPDQATLDHVIPLSKGGPHTYANLKTCCHSCNAAKSDKDVAQHIRVPMQLTLV